MILDRDKFGIWSFISKRFFKAIFEKPNLTKAEESIRKALLEKNIAMYIHVPFCKSFCFYCPYVRYTWNENLASKYVEALKVEIRKYGELFEDMNLKIEDVHVGGGTPSLLAPSQFKEILVSLTENFECDPKIAIEANPEDITNKDRTYDLVSSGINKVSLGVQSFNDEMLKKLGRKHKAKDSFEAMGNLREAGVERLNIDMMYMIPSQTLNNWRADLEIAVEQDIDEITCYPTLITPYCLASKKGFVENQPSKKTFKEMIYLTFDMLKSKGFEPIEIYGFTRKKGWKYVTVNYEMEGPLLGLGCGATGFIGGYEYHNTCSVEEYIKCVHERKLPIAGGRNVDARERAIRYTACRLFICRRLDFDEFEKKFGNGFDELINKTNFKWALKFPSLLGHVKKDSKGIELAEKGLLTAHQICWTFVLNFPCRVAEEFTKEPWPQKVAVP